MPAVLLFGILSLVVATFWAGQFAQLMALKDSDFPGSHDKALWVVAFIVGSLGGAFAFWLWKKIMVSVHEAEAKAKAS